MKKHLSDWLFIMKSKNDEKPQKKDERNTKNSRGKVVIIKWKWYTKSEVMRMTLKELRISKGLGQKDCADFLGMTVRNYQNYENKAEKVNTAKYHAIYQKLESYKI